MRVYETELGNTVVDKRHSIPERVQSPKDPGSDTSPSGTSGEQPFKLRRTFLRGLVGYVIKWSRADVVPRIECRTLTDLLLTRPGLRAIISRQSEGIAIADVAELVADASLGDWRAAAYMWIREVADPRAVADVVSTEIEAETNNAKRALYLRAIPKVAEVLSDAQARALLNYLLSIVDKSIDPYTANGDVLLGRRCVSSLLRQRPELEEIVLARLDNDNDAEDRTVRTELRLLAVALRERGLSAATVFANAVSRARLDEDDIDSLARLADAPLDASLRVDSSADSLALNPGANLRRLAMPVVGLAVVSLCALLAQHLLPRVQPIYVQVAPAIATLALLATVQVFAGNLSGSRLPSAIARYTSQSWQLDGAYFASVALIFLAVFPTTAAVSAAWATPRNWLSTGALVFWTCMLLMALLTVFRRVDASRAAAGFLSAKKRRARVVGRRFGRYQAMAAELTSMAGSSTPLEIRVDAVPDVWDQPIVATARGVFLPKRRSFLRLMSSEPVRAGLKVRFTVVLASTVNRYDTIAHVVPLRDQGIDRRWLRRARKAMKVHRVSAFDDVRSAATALSKLSSDLAAGNDIGTAHQVAQSLTAFVNYHVLCTRQSRQRQLRRWWLREYVRDRSSDRLDINSPSSMRAPFKVKSADTPTTVNFVLREILDIATRTAITASGPAFDVPEYIVRSLLRSNTHEEHGVNVVSATVGAYDIRSSAEVFGAVRILRVAGLRALEQRQAISFNLLLDRIVALRLDDDASRIQAQNLVVDLTGYACRYGSDLAISGCAALQQLHRSPPPADVGTLDSRGAYDFWMVGGAALAVGALSVAVATAKVCEQQGWGARIADASKEYDVLDTLASRAELIGNYLGVLPRDALATFGRFLVARAAES
jgi:hypothetical protein